MLKRCKSAMLNKQREGEIKIVIIRMKMYNIGCLIPVDKCQINAVSAIQRFTYLAKNVCMSFLFK